MNWIWLENLTKPFASLVNPVAERFGNWLGSRKPRLHVHFEPMTNLWCIAGTPGQELMQAMFTARFTHDDPKQTLLIVNAYPQGTQVEMKGSDTFSIPPLTLVTERVYVFVSPAPEKGKTWRGRFVFEDQFHRKYKEKTELKWAGPRDEKVGTVTGAPDRDQKA